MAMLPTCPTCPSCKVTDATYRHPATRECKDPWHADAHLRRKAEAERLGVPEAALGSPRRRVEMTKAEIEQLGRPRERAIDKEAVRVSSIQVRAAMARDIFEKDLAAFVKRWAPDDPWNRDNFQRDLMMLMRDAMEHKSMTFGLHLERTEPTLDALSMHASASLQAIYPEPNYREMESFRQGGNLANKPKGE